MPEWKSTDERLDYGRLPQPAGETGNDNQLRKGTRRGGREEKLSMLLGLTGR